MLTLLTVTGCRAAAFKICQYLMQAQDYAGPVKWIVVDDGPEPQQITFQRDGWHVISVTNVPKWQPGQNTQSANLLAGLRYVDPDDRLVIIEDDDYYATDWLSTVDRYLDQAELVGECRARYYNVTRRIARQLNNMAHASLCSTAMRGDAIETFRNVLPENLTFIDIKLWQKHKSKRLFDGHRVVGIKGLPGRGGIGIGHKDDFSGRPDPDLTLLQHWIGDFATQYEPFYK